jgi:endonuclease/exonuclease/phosphatase (EEP) superfamily protein YafD
VAELLLYCLSAIVACLTLAPHLRHEVWWIRATDFPRLQFAVLAIIAATGFPLVVWPFGIVDAVTVLIVLACLWLQLSNIAPYTRLYATELKQAAHSTPERQVSILVANVLQTNRRSKSLLEIVRKRQPDVFLALETDHWWDSELAQLTADYPYRIAHPRENLYGMHLFSKLACRNPKVEFLVDPEIPSISTVAELRCGEEIKLHCLHPTPPSPTENPTSIDRDGELLMVAKSVAQSREPAIVFGDLNDVAWSETTRLFQKISGMLDPRIGRGMYSTYNTKIPLLRWPLDHFFVSESFALIALERLEKFGSDHFPIMAVFQLGPYADENDDIPRPSDEERAIAEDKIDRAGTDET